MGGGKNGLPPPGRPPAPPSLPPAPRGSAPPRPPSPPPRPCPSQPRPRPPRPLPAPSGETATTATKGRKAPKALVFKGVYYFPPRHSGVTQEHSYTSYTVRAHMYPANVRLLYSYSKHSQGRGERIPGHVLIQAVLMTSHVLIQAPVLMSPTFHGIRHRVRHVWWSGGLAGGGRCLSGGFAAAGRSQLRKK